jgi:hypothetical protein
MEAAFSFEAAMFSTDGITGGYSKGKRGDRESESRLVGIFKKEFFRAIGLARATDSGPWRGIE